jgi:hypothetical protein
MDLQRDVCRPSRGLMLRFRVKGTGESYTRRVERMAIDGRGALLIERDASREMWALDQIEDLQIGPGPAKPAGPRQPD